MKNSVWGVIRNLWLCKKEGAAASSLTGAATDTVHVETWLLWFIFTDGKWSIMECPLDIFSQKCKGLQENLRVFSSERERESVI